MEEIAANAVVSIVISCALFALLPRGVVLTRRLKVLSDPNAPHQTWEICNDSPLPIRLTKVSYCSIGTYNDVSGRIEQLDLPTFDSDASGIELSFDDEILDISRQERSQPWSKVEVPPGDTLTAFVNLNSTLAVRYRRAGVFGVLERRRLTIDGGV